MTERKADKAGPVSVKWTDKWPRDGMRSEERTQEVNVEYIHTSKLDRGSAGLALCFASLFDRTCAESCLPRHDATL